MAGQIPSSPFNPERFTGLGGLLTRDEASRLQDLIKGAFDNLARQIRDHFILIPPGLPPGTSGAPNDARFWLSIARAGLPNAVDMGALGPGVIQQLVAAGIAAPQAFLTHPGRVLYGSATAGLLADSADLFFNAAAAVLGVGTNAPDAGTTATATRIHARGTLAASAPGVRGFLRNIIQNADPTGMTILLLLNDYGIQDPTTPFAGAGAAMYYTGSTWAGPEGKNTLVLMAPNPGIVVSGTPGMAFGISGDRKLLIEFVDAASTRVRVANPNQPSTGGSSSLFVDNSQAGVKGGIIVHGHTHATFADQTHLSVDGGPLRFVMGGVDRGHIDQVGDWFVESLKAGGSVAADPGTGRLKIGISPGGLGAPIVDGDDGQDGIDGLPGATGLQGLPGRDGAPGIPGLDGEDGEMGPPGRDGAPGRDGNSVPMSDTADDYVEPPWTPPQPSPPNPTVNLTWDISLAGDPLIGTTGEVIPVGYILALDSQSHTYRLGAARQKCRLEIIQYVNSFTGGGTWSLEIYKNGATCGVVLGPYSSGGTVIGDTGSVIINGVDGDVYSLKYIVAGTINTAASSIKFSANATFEAA